MPIGGPAFLVVAAALSLSGCADNTIQGLAQTGEVTTAANFTTRASVPVPDSSDVRGDTPSTTAVTPSSTIPEIIPVQQSVAPSSIYMSEPGAYYFQTPSGKFLCGIETAIRTGGTARVGCQGELPSSAPALPAPGAPDNLIPANTILAEGAGPGDFMNSGGVMFAPDGGAPQVLPYGEALRVDGYECLVSPEVGVTCTTPYGHGFAVSSSTYGTW